MELKRTPLYPVYEQHGGRVIDFGGWALPVQFAGIQQEHDAVRQAAGLFDVSHMGEVEVRGKGAFAFLQRLTTNDVAKLEPGQAQYSLMCYPDGGVVDDLLVYRLGEAQYLLIINASNIDKDIVWMREQADADVQIEDRSDDLALLALQGPKAEKILQKLTSVPLQGLKPFHFIAQAELGGEGLTGIISRTGYTGEDGFELCVPKEQAIELWNRLLAVGAPEGLVPAGLGARDTLRFEARLPLYGQELSKDITPIEAGVGMFVRPEKGDFIGRDTLAEQKANGAQRKLVGLEMIDRGIPRTHYAVYAGDRKIGEVTTGTQSPTFKTNVGLALIERAFSAPGTELDVEIRGKRLKAKVVRTPFYKRATDKMGEQ